MGEEYITPLTEEIEGGITKKVFQKVNRTESPILGALSKLDEFLLKPQVQTCSVAVPGTSRNNNSENRKPTGDQFPNNPCRKAVCSDCHISNLNHSQQ